MNGGYHHEFNECDLPYKQNVLNNHSIYIISRKPVRCTRKLLKIKSKLILISFTSFLEFYVFLLCILPLCRDNCDYTVIT